MGAELEDQLSCPSFIGRIRLRFARRASEWPGRAPSRIACRKLLTLLPGLLSVSTALAQTPIPGSYAPFTVTRLKAGIMPPPGTIVLENGSIFYDTNKFVASSGNEISTSTNETFVNRTTIGYVAPNFKNLGGDFNHTSPHDVSVSQGGFIHPTGARIDEVILDAEGTGRPIAVHDSGGDAHQARGQIIPTVLPASQISRVMRREHYNTKRPYGSLRNKTPPEFWLEFEDGLAELVG